MMDQHRSAAQKLPAGLAGVLNAPVDNRDSAYYSGTDSKHTSTASGMGVLSPPTSGFHPSPIDKTPSPTAKTDFLPRVSPTSGHMSVAAMVSPTTPGSADPRRYDRPQSIDSAPHSATFGDMPEALSRRESVDSRMNQGFNDMRLGNSHNNSPYATHNHSTTSIHNTLQQQRNPRPGLEGLSAHRISNGYQPNAERNPDINPKTRVAPAITGPTTSQIARAAEPTKGQAWAFPEEEIRHVPSAASLSVVDSRRSSIAESIASSQYTTESRLPPGQRRLEDGMLPTGYPTQRLSSASGEFSTVHHHSLQHRQIGDLRDEEGFPVGSQPYSRTPELRVSHKLAERKRRTEMKELFEQLRDLMPQERGSKASKWEILTKAIAEHQRQTDMIRQAQIHLSQKQAENDSMAREIMALRAQLNQQPQHRGGPVSGASQYEADPYGRSSELPPLRTLQSPTGPAPPEAMSGVQYEPRPMNGYRGSDQRRF
ncbi:protein esc1 [Podospora conica]|nr:protein esc1 [Schizothecium conicum]